MRYINLLLILSVTVLAKAAEGQSMIYDMGKRQGEKTADNAWRKLEDNGCSGRGWDNYYKIIKDAGFRIAESKSSTADYRDGFANALSEALARHEPECAKPVVDSETLPDKDEKPPKILVPKPVLPKKCQDNSFCRLGYNGGYASVGTLWLNLRKQPDAIEKLPKLLQKILDKESQSDAIEHYESDAVAEYRRGFVAGANNRLNDIASECKCDVTELQSIVIEWAKKK